MPRFEIKSSVSYRMHYPQYHQFSDRLATYNKWYMCLVKGAGDLARAGLFYTGFRDETCCFNCGVYIRNWRSRDNVLDRHEQMSPLCSFVAELRRQQQIIARDEFERVCKICYDDDIAVVHVPCSHAVSCLRCSLKMYTCPLCRIDIEARIKIIKK